MEKILELLNIGNASMPGVLMLISIIKAHFNATGEFPTEEQILAAVPVKVQSIKDLWGAWTASHPDPPTP